MPCRVGVAADSLSRRRSSAETGMLPILGDLLPYAVPVALSPLPIIAVAVLLLAPAGTRGGVGFLVGRLGALTAATLMFAALSGLLDGDAAGAGKRGWLRIGIGLVLMVWAAAVWRKAGAAAEPPGWLKSIDRATPAGALRLGVTLTLVNPKELAFAFGAGLMIGGLPAGRAVLAAVVFSLVAGLGVAVPVFAMLLAGDGARGRLGGVRDWLVSNQAAVMAAVLLLIGAMLIGSGIEAL
jgi:hypothetical protein